MKIQLTGIEISQIVWYLKRHRGIKNPTAIDIGNEVHNLIATKYCCEETPHIYFRVGDIDIIDPLYDETGRYPLPNPIQYWISLGVNRDIAIESVQNAQINAC